MKILGGVMNALQSRSVVVTIHGRYRVSALGICRRVVGLCQSTYVSGFLNPFNCTCY